MKAVVMQSRGKAVVVSDKAKPKLRPGYMIVKTVCVALNPTDWKHIDNFFDEGALVGCDYSGIVEEVGPDITKQFKKGDKVYGVTHGSDNTNHENGCFAEYIAAKGDLTTKKPDNLSFEEAATLGVGIGTIGQGLYQSLRLPLPTAPAKEPFPLLVYGGSTATGTLAIEFAKLSGLTVVATCSSRNFDLCKSYGADATFDYNDPSCAEKIHEFTEGKLHKVFDTISEPQTAAICAAAMSQQDTDQNFYSNLLLVKKLPRNDMQYNRTLLYTAFGERYIKGDQWMEANPEHFEFLRKFLAEVADPLIAEGKIKVHPPEVRGEGLKGVLSGLQDLKAGKVSGKKLVYRVEETP